MTTVNSPACLLARNCFYRHLPHSPDQMKPVESSCQNDSIRHKQRQVSLGVTMATTTGGSRSKGLWVDIILGCSSPSLHVPTSKPGDRDVK